MKVIVGKELLFANANQAGENRALFNKHKVTVVNLISSPGSGKTTLLEKTAELLGNRLKMGVIVGDLYTARDAERIEAVGLSAVQINTDGMCHLTAGMIAQALKEIRIDDLNVLFIENIGNLVCPAAFDLGEHAKVALLSVTEGMDKPAKYPGIFREARAAVITKEDLLPYTDFDLHNCLGEIRDINGDTNTFITSAKTGQGLEDWCVWLEGLVEIK